MIPVANTPTATAGRTRQRLRLPPRVPGALPLIGHTVDFARDTIGLLFRAYRECGEVAAFQAAHRKMALLTGPEAQEAFFRAPDEQLNPSEPYKIMAPVFGEGLVYDATPDRMAEHFGMLMPALRDRRMRTYAELIVEEVERSIAGWGDEGVIDIVDYTRVLTNFTSSLCLLGREFRDEMTDEFARVYHDLERGVTPVAYISPHLPIPAFRKRNQARVRLVEMITEVVAKRRAKGRRGEDFLQTLMEARYKDGTALTEHEITGLLLAAMFAGHHTSSVTTAWTLLELLRAPAYLDRVLAELEAVFGDGRPVDFLSLREVPLVEYAIKEALRLHPPLFMLLRGVMRDFVYKGYRIPAGWLAVTSPLVSHRLPHVFRDPDRFDPDRFGPGRQEDKRAFTFISFGGGRHRCLGNAFALLQVKAIFSVLLRRYRFESVGDPLEGDFGGLVLGPKQPARVRYRRIDRTPRVVVPAATAGQGATGEGRAAGAYCVRVDRDLCQGHGVCASEAPGVFRLGEDGVMQIVRERPGADLRAQVEAAVRYCPNQALSLVEDEG